MPQKLTTRAFIEKARARHGERYGYEAVKYINSQTLITIICPEHGEFEQNPNAHLVNKGCNACAILRARKDNPNKLAPFIEKARAVWGEKYDYSYAEYQGAMKPIRIDCPTCGPFMQRMDAHLNGNGCKKCTSRHKKRGETTRLGPKVWLEKFIAVHGKKYTYSEIPPSICAQDYITIQCPEHGPFSNTVSRHAQGVECAKCAVRGGFRRSQWIKCQKERNATLYIVHFEGNGESFFKVGITFLSVKKRFQTGRVAYKFETVALYRSYDAGKIYDLETLLHRAGKFHQYQPLIPFGGQTECFSSILPILPLLPKETFFLKNRIIA